MKATIVKFVLAVILVSVLMSITYEQAAKFIVELNSTFPYAISCCVCSSIILPIGIGLGRK